MRILENIEPKAVFAFFEDLCNIPHGSGNTKAVSDYCVDFAQKRNLEYQQDAHNNVIIIKPATSGYEEAAPLILQGHLDMVCEKAPGCSKDMTKEGLDLVAEGDLVYAKGTTLGGDDGIAVAMALAALDDESLVHPRLEAVFTIDEEVGMLGATALDMSILKGRNLLNIDSELEGVFTVSCAGGNRTTCKLPVEREPYKGTCLKLVLDGLIGGHSGTEINKGRANANQLLGRLLDALSTSTDFRLLTVEGGLKDNAIANAAMAQVIVSDEQTLRSAAQAMLKTLQHEYGTADPHIQLTITAVEPTLLPMNASSTSKVICFLLCAPYGVQAMSMDIPDLVQTSLNLGILTTTEELVTASYSVRSSIASQKQMLSDRLRRLADYLGGTTTVRADYPGWEYKKHSALRDTMTAIYVEQYGKEPKIEAIHAGLECGIFIGKLPDLDCVSIGPELREIHTYRENLSIASVQRVWKFVAEVIRRSALQK